MEQQQLLSAIPELSMGGMVTSLVTHEQWSRALDVVTHGEVVLDAKHQSTTIPQQRLPVRLFLRARALQLSPAKLNLGDVVLPMMSQPSSPHKQWSSIADLSERLRPQDAVPSESIHTL